MSLSRKAARHRQATEADKLRGEVADLKRQLNATKLALTEVDRYLEDLHRSKFGISKQKIRRYRGGKSFVRVAFGDTHGSQIDQPAWRAIKADLEHLKPRQVVHIGDLVECGGWLAQHHTANYVPETEYTFADDINATNQFLDELQQACPTAELHFLEGNHDARIEKWCIQQTQRNKVDASFLLDRLGPRALCHLDERGIQWYRRSVVYGDLNIPGTIRLGRCCFTHPQSSSKHHAANMVAKFKTNVVFGHTHRADYYPGSNVKRGDQYGAWNPGCVCQLQKYWRHTEPSGHNHGYHIQLVRPDGAFLGINVPIIDGQSYLAELVT